jgi:hypothetical protein
MSTERRPAATVVKTSLRLSGAHGVSARAYWSK